MLSMLRMKALIWLSCLVLTLACSDHDEPNFGGNGGAGGEPPTMDPSRCESGCVLTLEADCNRGPADQETCVSDCEALESGECSAEYAELQSCSTDEPVTCNDQGFPIVEACSEQQATFVACLNP
jgi:hypothetical protein